MKRILYLMGIDWHWIKQRPQILAEMLSNDYDVTVAYYKEIIVKVSLRKDKDELEKSIPIPVIPYRDKSRIIHFIQKCIFRLKIKNIEQYDAIWIGHPLLYRFIPRSYQGKIIYDCMDNHMAMCGDGRIRKMIGTVEPNLIERADWIITSSKRLKHKIEKIYQTEVSLVRNGFVAGQIHKPRVMLSDNKNISVGYFGTIAEWLDFKGLLKCLSEIEAMKCFLWGPVLTSKAPKHTRLFYEGVVEHNQLWDSAKDMDCLIMPFIVNDIIKDVDPVKLYEYISMGKTIIAPYYKEIKRFEPYVYFYRDEEELLDLLKLLQEGKLECKYTAIQQANFLKENTWKNRYDKIKKLIENG